jgi:hypothetical protein
MYNKIWILPKYTKICKKMSLLVSNYDEWWFVDITDKNPKILKGKKHTIA